MKLRKAILGLVTGVMLILAGSASAAIVIGNVSYYFASGSGSSVSAVALVNGLAYFYVGKPDSNMLNTIAVAYYNGKQVRLTTDSSNSITGVGTP